MEAKAKVTFVGVFGIWMKHKVTFTAFIEVVWWFDTMTHSKRKLIFTSLESISFTLISDCVSHKKKMSWLAIQTFRDLKLTSFDSLSPVKGLGREKQQTFLYFTEQGVHFSLELWFISHSGGSVDRVR